jgi:predicted nucleic acid-binding protein
MAKISPIAYFDSCIFIHLLRQKKTGKEFDACQALLKQAESGKLLIVSSTIAIVEVNRIDGHSGLPVDQSKDIFKFFLNRCILLRTPDRPTMEYAHELSRTFKGYLKPMDAIHVATAMIARVPVFYTYDGNKPNRSKGGLLKLDGKISRVGGVPLRIEVPPDPDNNTLLKFAKPDDDSDDDENVTATQR